MTERQSIDRRIEEIQRQRDALDCEMRRLEELRDKGGDDFERCRAEARFVEQQMDAWDQGAAAFPFAGSRLALLFLGAVSGEWAAQCRWRGNLPGFGGFLLAAGGLNIVIDPGRTSLGNLHAAGIHPKTLDLMIATHSHWDCTRDLQLLLMSATDSHISSARTGKPRLRLLAPRSVLYGLPMDAEAVIRDPYFAAAEDLGPIRARLSEFPTMNAAALSAYDLFVRLGGAFDSLEMGRRYDLNAEVTLRTRRSHHRDTFGWEWTTALDFLVREHGKRAARCVYLSDTEYHQDLADQYATELDELGPIDVLICNVKTLDARAQPAGPYAGFTRRHLGWKGLIQLVKDLQRRGALTKSSLVVMRAWGIETVTRLDAADGVMMATPEKLGVYEETFVAQTGQAGLVPGLTWVALPEGTGSAEPTVQHLRAPYPAKGAFLRFGNVSYCSEAMAETIRALRPAVDERSEFVLITGETGTGKDFVARSMHFEAQRAGELRNENAFNLAGPIGWDQLVGHSKGAFTDASSNREGLLKVTQGGTLVIQEIGDMPIEQQVQLLTVLCEREYHRVGEAKPIPLSTQVIATTCHDVEDLVAKGKFRKELLYRFQRRVHITPLRERIEDVRAIVHGWHFEKPEDFPLLDDEAIALLQGYDWPGNVRQLQNVFERLRAARDWSLAAIRREIENELRSGGSPQAEAASGLDLDPEEQELLDLIPWDRAVRRRDLEEASPGAAKNTLVHRLNRLVEKRLVCRVGSGPNLRYRRLWKPVDEG